MKIVAGGSERFHGYIDIWNEISKLKRTRRLDFNKRKRYRFHRLLENDKEFGFISYFNKIKMGGRYDVAVIFNEDDLEGILDFALSTPNHRALVAKKLAESLSKAAQEN